MLSEGDASGMVAAVTLGLIGGGGMIPHWMRSSISWRRRKQESVSWPAPWWNSQYLNALYPRGSRFGGGTGFNGLRMPLVTSRPRSVDKGTSKSLNALIAGFDGPPRCFRASLVPLTVVTRLLISTVKVCMQSVRFSINFCCSTTSFFNLSTSPFSSAICWPSDVVLPISDPQKSSCDPWWSIPSSGIFGTHPISEKPRPNYTDVEIPETLTQIHANLYGNSKWFQSKRIKVSLIQNDFKFPVRKLLKPKHSHCLSTFENFPNWFPIKNLQGFGSFLIGITIENFHNFKAFAFWTWILKSF